MEGFLSQLDSIFCRNLLLSPPTRLLRVHHVCRLTGRPERTIRHLARTGRLKGFKTGPKLWAFFASDVRDFICAKARQSFDAGDIDFCEKFLRVLQHPQGIPARVIPLVWEVPFENAGHFLPPLFPSLEKRQADG